MIPRSPNLLIIRPIMKNRIPLDRADSRIKEKKLNFAYPLVIAITL